MFVIRISTSISHTGYNYWNQEEKIALLDLDNATTFETEEEALACAEAITDKESPRGIPWFDVVSVEAATIQWEEILGRAGTNHNPHRHAEATKLLVSPNQVMIAVECRGVLFDCPNFKQEDPLYLDIIESAYKDVAQRKELTRYLNALTVAIEKKAPEEVSESTKREWLVEGLAWIYYIVLHEAPEDGAAILKEYVDTGAATEENGLDIINCSLDTLTELAGKVVKRQNPLSMDMQGMDWYKSIVDKIFELWDTNNNIYPFAIESPVTYTIIGTEHERSFAMEMLRQYSYVENVYQAINVGDTLKHKDVLISANAITFTNAPLAIMQLSGFMPWNSPAATPMRQQMALKEKSEEHGFDVSDFTQGQFDANAKRS